MKTRTMKLSIELPATEAEFVAGLRLEDDEGYRRTERAVLDATAELERMRQREATARDDISRLQRDVPSGNARLEDLEAAVSRQRASELSLPGFEQRLADAKRAHDHENVQAKKRILAEATRRITVLKRAAAQVTPVLEQLKDLEYALDRVAPGTPAVEWPMSLIDEGAREYQTRSTETRAAEAISANAGQ